MRKPIFIDFSKPQTLRVRLGTGVRAYVYGSVIKGTAKPGSDLDVYVAGPNAKAVEDKYALSRRPVLWEGEEYSLHIIGPETVDEETFLESQPEAIQVL